MKKESSQIDYSTHISRRKVLGFSAATIGAYTLSKVAGPAIEQGIDERKALMSNSEFLSYYESTIGRIHLGASFSPEQFGVYMSHHGNIKGSMEDALDGFSFAISDLGLKDIRLGIMWENAVDNEGNIDLSMYEPFIEDGLRMGVRFCINYGYKSLRWPEQHPPTSIKESSIMLSKGSTVTVETDLARQAHEYTYKMSEYLKKSYKDKISMIQPENEPFQKFGDLRQDIGVKYMQESVRIVDEAFPQAKILINAGGSHIEKVVPFIREIVEKRPDLYGKLVSGVDVHLDNPNKSRFARIFGLDTMTMNKLVSGDIYEWHKRRTKELGIPIEVSEAQIEAYGTETSPLYSVKKLRKVLIRCFDDILNIEKGKEPSVLRLWGVENQFKVVREQGITSETRKRLNLIRSITERQAA